MVSQWATPIITDCSRGLSAVWPEPPSSRVNGPSSTFLRSPTSSHAPMPWVARSCLEPAQVAALVAFSVVVVEVEMQARAPKLTMKEDRRLQLAPTHQMLDSKLSQEKVPRSAEHQSLHLQHLPDSTARELRRLAVGRHRKLELHQLPQEAKELTSQAMLC